MRLVALLPCLLLLVGCTSSAVVRSAESDDPQTFRSRLPELLKAEVLDLDDAQQVARQVMKHDIARAKGRWDRTGLEELSRCAAELDAALADRGAQRDRAAAQATMIRLEAGQVEPFDHAHRVTSRQDHWRAVGARALVMAEPAAGRDDTESRRRLAGHGRWRRKLMADPAAAVRRAALRAAAIARDPHDAGAILEAVKLDPDPEVRQLATEAAGALGTRDTVLGLADLWPQADESERPAIAAAWSQAAARVPEARQRLIRTAQTASGRAAVVAALALMDGQSPEDAGADATAAAAVLVRHIEDGPTAARAAAIDSASMAWPELREAVFAVRDDADPIVAAAAWARLVEEPALQQEAQSELRKLAAFPSEPGQRAKEALIRVPDPSVVKWLERDAQSKSAMRRQFAGEGFARLGRYNQAVSMMGDDDPRVRAAVACALVRLDQDEP